MAFALAIVSLGLFASGAMAAKSSVDRLGPAPAGQDLKLVLPLRADLGGLERFATAVTTVGSQQYGQFQPIAVLARRFGASAGDRATVVGYLKQAGATQVKIDATGLFADATMSVGSAERTFGAPLARFQATRATRFLAPVQRTHLPAALGSAVTGVVGLSTRPVPNAPSIGLARASGLRSTPAAGGRTATTGSGYSPRGGTPAGCQAGVADSGFTPNQYLDAYGFTPLHAVGILGQGERAALIEVNGFRYSDLASFASCFGLPVPAIHSFGVNISSPLGPGAETTLDLQILDATAPGLRSIDVYETQSRPSDLLSSITAPLQNRGHVPDVLSASLGICELGLKAAVGSAGVRSAEGAMALAAATGISLVASSGDTGSSACVNRFGVQHRLAVNFPASSPFVTGVGGSNLHLSGANQITSQPVWNDSPINPSAGGGGSSMLFGRPAFQNGSYGGRTRGVPDVTMLADLQPGYNIFCTVGECNGLGGGPWIVVGGTSAAAPMVAGGLLLVDQVLRERHRQNLGAADPLLYRIARHYRSSGAISDIRIGNNDIGGYLSVGGHRALGCCRASVGYDRASGLGSLNLARLATLAVALQPRIARIGISLPRQSPAARGHLLAKLTCSRRCLIQAGALVTISGGQPLAVSSSRHLLKGGGRRTVQLSFSRQQLSWLRAALRRHRRVYAFVYGQLSDAGGNPEATTRVHKLRVRY